MTAGEKHSRYDGAVKASLTFGGAALAALLVSMACGSTKPQGGLVIGLETDVAVPDNVDGIGISIGVNGQIKYSKLFALSPNLALNGKKVVKLPATMVIMEPTSDGPAPSVNIRAVAFHQGEARIVRDVISTVPHGRTALLRMPLAYLGYNDGVKGTVPTGAFEDPKPKGIFAVIHTNDTSDAGLAADLITTIDSRCTALQHLTNVDGECVDATIDSSTLPDYEDAELFENGKDENGDSNPEPCFDVDVCFAPASSSHADLNRSNGECTVTLEGSEGSADNLNVAMTIQQSSTAGAPKIGFCVPEGSTRCMVPIDRDDVHGFRVDTARGVVILPKGVCDRPTVTGVELTHSCASKPVVMPIDGAGANCIPNASDAGIAEGGTDGGTDADAALPEVPPWYGDNGTTGVVALGSGDVVEITKAKLLSYISTDSAGGPLLRSAIKDASPSSAASGPAFVTADPTVPAVYATFNDANIAHVLYVLGKGFTGGATNYIMGPGPDPSEQIGQGVPSCVGTVCFPSSPTVRSFTFPVLTASGATTSTTLASAPYLGAFAFAVAPDESLFGSYAAVFDGGTGTAVAAGKPGNYIELRLTGAPRAYGTAVAMSGTSFHMVVTEAQQDGLVHVLVIDTAAPANPLDAGTIGLASDPGFLMRNLAVAERGMSHYVYLTDSAGNLKYVDPFAAAPTLVNVDKLNRVCATSLGVSVDSTHVYRACHTGVTRDNLVQ